MSASDSPPESESNARGSRSSIWSQSNGTSSTSSYISANSVASKLKTTKSKAKRDKRRGVLPKRRLRRAKTTAAKGSVSRGSQSSIEGFLSKGRSFKSTRKSKVASNLGKFDYPTLLSTRSKVQEFEPKNNNQSALEHASQVHDDPNLGQAQCEAILDEIKFNEEKMLEEFGKILDEESRLVSEFNSQLSFTIEEACISMVKTMATLVDEAKQSSAVTEISKSH